MICDATTTVILREASYGMIGFVAVGVDPSLRFIILKGSPVGPRGP